MQKHTNYNLYHLRLLSVVLLCDCCRAQAAQTTEDWSAVRREFEIMTDELRDAPPFNSTVANLSTNTKRVLARRYAYCASILCCYNASAH
jgi:hypothetical protein